MDKTKGYTNMRLFWVVALFCGFGVNASSYPGYLVVEEDGEFNNARLVIRNLAEDVHKYQISSVTPEKYKRFSSMIIYGLRNSVSEYNISIKSFDEEIQDSHVSISTAGIFENSLFRIMNHSIVNNDERKIKFAVEGIKLMEGGDYEIHVEGPYSSDTYIIGDDMILDNLDMGSEYSVYISATLAHAVPSTAIYRTGYYSFTTGFNKVYDLKVKTLSHTKAVIEWAHLKGQAYNVAIKTTYSQVYIMNSIVVDTSEFIADELQEGNAYTVFVSVVSYPPNQTEEASKKFRTDGYGIQTYNWKKQLGRSERFGGLVYMFRPIAPQNKITWPFAVKLILCDGATLKKETTNCQIENYNFGDDSNSFLVTQRKTWMYRTGMMAVQYSSDQPNSCEIILEEFNLPIMLSHTVMLDNLTIENSGFNVKESWNFENLNYFLVKVDLTKYFYINEPTDKKFKNNSLTYKPDFVRMTFIGSDNCTGFKFNKKMTNNVRLHREWNVKGIKHITLKQDEIDFFINDLSIFFTYDGIKNKCSKPYTISLKLFWRTISHTHPVIGARKSLVRTVVEQHLAT